MEPRKRNPIWDGICEAFGLNPVTRRECMRIGAIVRDLQLKEIDPADIPRRYLAHEKAWPSIRVTPESLLKHWDELAPRIRAQDRLFQDRLAFEQLPIAVREAWASKFRSNDLSSALLVSAWIEAGKPRKAPEKV